MAANSLERQNDFNLPFAPSGFAARVALWSEAGLGAATLLFFPVLVLLPRGVAAMFTAAGLCGAGLVLSASRKKPSSTIGVTAVLLVCLVLWGTISAWWSVNSPRTLVVATRLAGLFAAGLALAAAAGCIAAPRKLTLLFHTGLVLGIALVAAELATGGALGALFSDHAFQVTRLNQASISFAILLLPAAAVLVSLGHTVFALLLAAVTAATIFTLAGTTAKAVLAAGLPIGLLLYRSGSSVARIAAVLSVIAVITAPLTFARLERVPGVGEKADIVKISAGHRLLIWSFAGDRIAERVLTGWGLDASRAIPGGEEPIRPGESWMPLHPHNAALQIWLELGVPGAVLFALLIALAWRTLERTTWPRLFAAASGGSLTIALVGCLATYGIWQEWWLGTLWSSLFLILVMARVASRAADLPARHQQTGDPISTR